MQLTRRFRAERGTTAGHTIVEVVVVMVLLSTVVASLWSTLWQTQRSEMYSRNRTEALDDMRAAIGRMTKDLRQAYNINQPATSTRLDVDTYVDEKPARVVYDMSDGTLTRSVNGAEPTVVQTNLTNSSIFTYQPDALAPDVVAIVFAVRPDNLPETELVLNAEITFRNR